MGNRIQQLLAIPGVQTTFHRHARVLEYFLLGVHAPAAGPNRGVTVWGGVRAICHFDDQEHAA